MEHGSTPKIIFIAIALAIVIVLLSLGQYRSFSFGLNPVREGFFIAERIVTAPFHFAQEVWSDYVALVDTRSQNKELKKRLEQSQVLCMSMQELKGENDRLRAMLDFKGEHSVFTLFPARLVSQDITNVFKTVVLDRGSTSKIVTNMPVVSPLGLVGRVISISPHTSLVLLITDPNSAVPALIEETRTKCIVKGAGTNMVNVEYVRTSEIVAVGNMVVTSGLEGFFPQGLRIGRIAGIKRDPRRIFLKITVSPCVEMSKIEGVFGVGFNAANPN